MATQSDSSQVLKGLLDALVLQALSERDSYGFEIHQTITQRLEDQAALFRESTLYPLLHRLEAKGCVEPYWKPGNRGTDRKYYRITQAGRDYLKERVADWLKVSRILNTTFFDKKGAGK